MKKRKTVIAQFILTLQVLIVLVVSSFSWFTSAYNPSVDPFTLSVSSANGLYIILDGEALLETSKIDLHSLLGGTAIPTLVQSSSINGTDFVTLDASTIDTSSTDYWSSASFIEASANVHYLEFTFYLLTEDVPKDVFLSEDLSQFDFDYVTNMVDNVTAPNQIGPTSTLRVSMSFNNETPIIFGDEKENEIDGYQTKVVLTTGRDINPNVIREGIVEYGQVVHTFDEYFLGYAEYDNEENPIGYYTDSTKTNVATPVYVLGANQLVPVTVRVWMEGGDPDCVSTSQILDSTINVAINLCAKDHI